MARTYVYVRKLPKGKTERVRCTQRRQAHFWRLDRWVPARPGAEVRWAFVGLFTTESFARNVGRGHEGRTRVVRQKGHEVQA